MVNAFITEITEEPTGVGPWTYLLEGYGFSPDAVVARWDMDTFDGSTYPYLGQWKSAIGDFTLSGSAALVSGWNGHRQALFDSVDDYVSLGGLSDQGIKTVGILTRRASSGSGGIPFSFGPTYVQYTANGGINAVGGGTQYPTPALDTTKWHWLWLSFTGNQRRIGFNGEADITTDHSSTEINKIEIGRTQAGGSYGSGPQYVAAVVALNIAVTQGYRSSRWTGFANARPLWNNQ